MADRDQDKPETRPWKAGDRDEKARDRARGKRTTNRKAKSPPKAKRKTGKPATVQDDKAKAAEAAANQPEHVPAGLDTNDGPDPTAGDDLGAPVTSQDKSDKPDTETRDQTAEQQGQDKGDKRPVLSVVPEPDPSPKVIDLGSKRKKPMRGEEKELSPKEAKFVQIVAQGNTQTEAYRQAYKADNWSRGAVGVAASRVANRPHVKLAIEKATKQAEEKILHAGAGLRSFVLRRLQEEADNSGNTPAARVRALELLGKVEGVDLFVSRSEQVKRPADLSSEELQAQLKARLADLIKTSG